MIGITPEEAQAREICARLIPHTTSVHNVAIIAALLVEYDRRVTELLAANTAEAERRRSAEAELDKAWEEYNVETMRCANIEHERDRERLHREKAEALAERMWPIVEAVAGIKSPHDFAFTIFPNGIGGDDLIQTAVALVREREEMET